MTAKEPLRGIDKNGKIIVTIRRKKAMKVGSYCVAVPTEICD